METKLPGVHFVAPYFLNPSHRIRIDLVGAGGNGSQMLSALARMNHALTALGHPGLYVRVWDPDTVEEPNIGRQLFGASEIGLNKAIALTTRFNMCFGTDWDARSEKWRYSVSERWKPNIIISCVDNLDARCAVAKAMTEYALCDSSADEYRTWYWLDLGNAQRTGQAVLGSVDIPQPQLDNARAVSRLPFFSELYDIDAIDERDSGPSCSMAEALAKQDLFINSVLVQMSASLLWNLLRQQQIQANGFFLNLESLMCVPMEL